MKFRRDREFSLDDAASILADLYDLIHKDIEALTLAAAGEAAVYAQSFMRTATPFPHVGQNRPPMADQFRVEGEAPRLKITNAAPHAVVVEEGQGPNDPGYARLRSWIEAKEPSLDKETLDRIAHGTLEKIKAQGNVPIPVMRATLTWLFDQLTDRLEQYQARHNRGRTPALRALSRRYANRGSPKVSARRKR